MLYFCSLTSPRKSVCTNFPVNRRPTKCFNYNSTLAPVTVFSSCRPPTFSRLFGDGRLRTTRMRPAATMTTLTAVLPGATATLATDEAAPAVEAAGQCLSVNCLLFAFDLIASGTRCYGHMLWWNYEYELYWPVTAQSSTYAIQYGFNLHVTHLRIK